MIRHIPNILSTARIFLCLPLLILEPFSLGFMLLYTTAGITDMIDGPIARRTGHVTALGANLDGAADFLFALIVVIRILPAIEIAPWIVALIFVVIGMKCLSLFIAYIRHKELVLLHTYANKFAAFALFLFPLFYFVMNTTLLLMILIVIASLAFLEEILINSSSEKVQRDLKSIFYRK